MTNTVPTEFKHFPDLQAVASYVTDELLCTLRDDLQKMEGSEAEHYEDDDRLDMQNRIADIEAIAPLIENLPKIYAHLRMVANLDTTEDFDNRGECMENDDAVDTVDRLISEARQLVHRSEWDTADQLAVDHLTVGTKILSISGEMSDTNETQNVHTGPNAIGEVTDILMDQEHCFSVAFPNGVSVLLSKSELMDANNYRLYRLV